MNKEMLIESVKAYSSSTSDDIIHDLYEFFESNLCIPKGKNRHPYADVLHEWIEGSLLESEYDAYQFRTLEIATTILDDLSYRIKPQEPVYEWQWMDICPRSKKAFFMNDGEFMTDNEVSVFVSYRKPIKIEETKRVRK